MQGTSPTQEKKTKKQKKTKKKTIYKNGVNKTVTLQCIAVYFL